MSLSRRIYPPPLLRGEVERNIAATTSLGSISYFMDGSVDPIIHTAGRDKAFSLQIEVIDIMGLIFFEMYL